MPSLGTPAAAKAAGTSPKEMAKEIAKAKAIDLLLCIDHLHFRLQPASNVPKRRLFRMARAFESEHKGSRRKSDAEFWPQSLAKRGVDCPSSGSDAKAAGAQQRI